jgi:uncharacterized membrane protein YgdD (TMEM256/DUF423 family)
VKSIWITLGTIFAGLAVVAGAFAAHMLERAWGDDPRRLEWVETASKYQMYHSLALVAVGILSWQSRSWAARVAGISFMVGIVLFSGSLYLLAWTKMKWLGAITPIGGVSFLVGWLFLAIAGLSAPRGLSPPSNDTQA